MTFTVTNNIKAAALIIFALAIVAMGFYVAEADDAPGAGGMALVLLIGAVLLARKAVRGQLPAWALRTALTVGVLIAAFAASLTRGVAVAVPLFAQPQDVPSVVDSAPAPQYAAAVDRARALVRAAVLEQNLPGVSAAVGAGGTIVWAEGFGWRDVVSETPMTPRTQFNIGTAASAIAVADVQSLGLADTGADEAFAWSPEAIGEPGEDFPVFRMIRHHILQPLGVALAEYPVPGDRATFYVPRSDNNNPRRGRQLMYMRDLACCAGTMAFYSTATDLVRVGLANGVSIDGELAGGTVMSLLTRQDSGLAVAVLSNISHAGTAALGRKIADAFAKQP